MVGHDIGSLEDITPLYHLQLLDITEIRNARKGKEREGGAISDEEFALQLFEQELRNQAILESDHQLAISINTAGGNERAIRRLLQQSAEQESARKELALSIKRKDSLPSLLNVSRAQPGASRSTSAPSGPGLGARTSFIGQSSGSGSHFLPVVPREGASAPIRQEVECISCTEKADPLVGGVRTRCDHFYCKACIIQLFETSLTDDTLFPPRCDRIPIPLSLVQSLFDNTFVERFDRKTRERATASRVYCADPNCATFIGPTTTNRQQNGCPECGLAVCSTCASTHGPNVSCPTSVGEEQWLTELREQEHWQMCSNCHAVVELTMGCYHITCRCAAQFCYLCGETWKRCACRQWDEHHLEQAGQRQVVNQYGNALNPQARAQHVQAAVNRLRDYHDCEHQRWAYRPEGGRCETCHHHLPSYLYRCTGCQHLACARCRRNRL